ncbi:unnamed protein product [Coregonus sp. 'balchen']|nr:unnamed protein product [Coregonus sp. 'balchen']
MSIQSCKSAMTVYPCYVHIQRQMVMICVCMCVCLSVFLPVCLTVCLLVCLRMCQTTVVSVRQRPDFPVSGQWEVETERTEGQRETQVFDAVVVCTGHYTQPHLPLNDFPGIEEFEGRYLHSWEYRSAEGLQGKRVVVVRIGNSGGDIAVDASRVAEQVYLSTRRGAWVVSRVGAGGLPGDLMGTSRLDGLLQKLFPSWITRMIEKNLNQSFDHRLEIRGSSVVFEDGSVVDNVDVVVFATGYNYDFHFRPSSLRAKSGHRLSLYRHVFPPGLTRPTLAVVCLFGAWIICHTWTHPNLLGLLLRELGVGLRVLLGPCTPYQYRLRGPGQWDGARQAILTQWERVAQPFRTRLVTVPPRPWARLSPWLITLSGGAVMLAVVISQCNLTSALQASIYRSFTINISKEMMCFSDFPIPADYPNYMHHSCILQYFRLYDENLKLLQHIHFQTSVWSVRQRPDFSRSGQWEVVTENRERQEERHMFDSVIVCSGEVLSQDYKGPEDLHGKRVVVIGISNSGGDIAVESSRVAEQVTTDTGSNSDCPIANWLSWFGEKKLNAIYDNTICTHTWWTYLCLGLRAYIVCVCNTCIHPLLSSSVVLCLPPSADRQMDSMSQHVCVIGAGPSGLTSIKSSLDEGLKPTCFGAVAISSLFLYLFNIKPKHVLLKKALL